MLQPKPRGAAWAAAVLLAAEGARGAGCPVGWQAAGSDRWDSSRCFRVTRLRAPLAAHLCSREHAHSTLAALTSQREVDLVAALLSEAGSAAESGALTGLRWDPRAREGDPWSGWYWTDGSPVLHSLLRWGEGEPASPDGSRSCSVLQVSGALSVVDCPAMRPHVCALDLTSAAELRLSQLSLTPEAPPRDFAGSVLSVGQGDFAVAFRFAPGDPGDRRATQLPGGSELRSGTPARAAAGGVGTLLSKGPEGHSGRVAVVCRDSSDSELFPSVSLEVGQQSVAHAPVDWSRGRLWVLQRSGGQLQVWADGELLRRGPLAPASLRSEPLRLGDPLPLQNAPRGPAAAAKGLNGTLLQLRVLHFALDAAGVAALLATSHERVGAGRCAAGGKLLPSLYREGVSDRTACLALCQGLPPCVGAAWGAVRGDCFLHLPTPDATVRPLPDAPSVSLARVPGGGGIGDVDGIAAVDSRFECWRPQRKYTAPSAPQPGQPQVPADDGGAWAVALQGEGCPAVGSAAIATAEECSEAARALRKTSVPAVSVSRPNLPRGCVFTCCVGPLQFNSADGPPCSTADQCLCRRDRVEARRVLAASCGNASAAADGNKHTSWSPGDCADAAGGDMAWWLLLELGSVTNASSIVLGSLRAFGEPAVPYQAQPCYHDGDNWDCVPSRPDGGVCMTDIPCNIGAATGQPVRYWLVASVPSQRGGPAVHITSFAASPLAASQAPSAAPLRPAPPPPPPIFGGRGRGPGFWSSRSPSAATDQVDLARGVRGGDSGGLSPMAVTAIVIGAVLGSAVLGGIGVLLRRRMCPSSAVQEGPGSASRSPRSRFRSGLSFRPRERARSGGTRLPNALGNSPRRGSRMPLGVMQPQEDFTDLNVLSAPEVRGARRPFGAHAVPPRAGSGQQWRGPGRLRMQAGEQPQQQQQPEAPPPTKVEAAQPTPRSGASESPGTPATKDRSGDSLTGSPARTASPCGISVHAIGLRATPQRSAPPAGEDSPRTPPTSAAPPTPSAPLGRDHSPRTPAERTAPRVAQPPLIQGGRRKGSPPPSRPPPEQPISGPGSSTISPPPAEVQDSPATPGGRRRGALELAPDTPEDDLSV